MSDRNDVIKRIDPLNVEELLRGWLIHAHKGRQRHTLAARHFDKWNYWIGGLAAAVSAIVGTTVFIALEKQADNASDNTYFHAAIVALSLLSAILTNLTAFLKLSEKTERHRSAGVQYKIVIRELERILSAPAAVLAALSPSDPSVTIVQKQKDDLEQAALVVSERIYEAVEDDWKTRGFEFVKRAAELYETPGG